MKILDIHTKTTPKENLRVPIDNEAVKEFVFNNIDFELNEAYWNEIDSIFAEVWNHKIGRGGYFYWEEICNQVYTSLLERKLLISRDRVNTVVNLMLGYIESTGGFMEF
jgi:hypothetical protein